MENEDDRGRSAERGDEPVRVHEPVLLGETLDVLALAPGMVVVDATVGAGGHAREISRAIRPGGCLVGLDRDAEILARARESLSEEEGDSQGRAGVRLFQLVFSRMGEALEQLGEAGCDRVLLDLGVSSLQLDKPERGFSFMHDAPLDMRMDATAPLTAEKWLRRVPEAELATALFELGGERHSRRIAREIVRAAKRGAMTRTSDLVQAVRSASPRPPGRSRIHPATRTFQAIRMVVNDEVGELERGLDAAAQCLRPGGRVAVIAFHSVEDRVVKRFVRERMKPLHRKPITASDAECRRNPRSRSAKLRCGLQEPMRDA